MLFSENEATESPSLRQLNIQIRRRDPRRKTEWSAPGLELVVNTGESRLQPLPFLTSLKEFSKYTV